jgi:predicted flap endonuclease-1-like 5' DNA nuclease
VDEPKSKTGGYTMAKLSVIEGIGEAYELKLNAVGIKSLEKYLEACASKKGRDDLAEKTGISDKLILKWANRADLDRISGVGSEYADLLEVAGVDTVPELANRKPENLLKKMLEVNEEKKLVRKVLTLKQVEDWVDQAKKLPRVLNY